MSLSKNYVDEYFSIIKEIHQYENEFFDEEFVDDEVFYDENEFYEWYNSNTNYDVSFVENSRFYEPLKNHDVKVNWKQGL